MKYAIALLMARDSGSEGETKLDLHQTLTVVEAESQTIAEARVRGSVAVVDLILQGFNIANVVGMAVEGPVSEPSAELVD